MSRIAISAVAIGKMYHIGGERQQYRTLRDTLANAVKRPIERLRNPGAATHKSEDLWALKDVSLDVDNGEVLGIIGRNGSGKSTFLKVLSHITEPTEGRVEIHGRVGSLLEVGTGFHPELTGRENIQLNGAILGMTRAEIVDKFDEIVGFSEIGRFLDTPVKRYSSGMYVRLAFAVAAYMEPEILLIDEVLAVGDASFQKKCLGKMSSSGRAGRTVLFVSHNMVAVRNLCTRVMWLDQGQVRADGDPGEIIHRYLSTSASTLVDRSWSEETAVHANATVALLEARVSSPQGVEADRFSVVTPLEVSFTYRTLREGIRLNLSVTLTDDEGVVVFTTTSCHEDTWHGREFPPGVYRSSFSVPPNLLNDGLYRVGALFVKDETAPLMQCEDVLVFEVKDAPETRGAWHDRWVGAVRPLLDWTTDCIGD